MLSLQQVTGKDLGNDMSAWQQYVKGQGPPTPSVAERPAALFQTTVIYPETCDPGRQKHERVAVASGGKKP